MTRKRLCIQVSGIVQGVGFRPFVHSLAVKKRLAGFVANTTDGVKIEAEGTPENLKAFMRALTRNPPPHARITSVISRETGLTGKTHFEIDLSENTPLGGSSSNTLICPDMAICADCRRELFDPCDRRFRYPFVNCTHCGPRYTIMERLPYDRRHTTMKGFEMCGSCRTEYTNPLDRRFHAQPIACSACGPQVCLLDGGGNLLARRNQAIHGAMDALRHGRIVAIKGLGGFHLSVNAADHKAVQTLRKRKKRPSKPFALMVRDMNIARQFGRFGPTEERLLCDPANPIVLVHPEKDTALSEAIAPDNELLGIMLPATPLHCLLFETNAYPALVMTSANLQGAPLFYQNDPALEGLKTIADVFLMHDRDIHCRCDDSVVHVQHGMPCWIRRSRGYAPCPVLLHSHGPAVIGTGADSKNTVCLLHRNQAILSQHIGDLQDYDTYVFFNTTIEHLKCIFNISPELAAYDKHPGFYSSRWARERSGLAGIAVQHHHAHFAACLAENHCHMPAIGIILDGTGYGNDGAVWGGEILIGDFEGFERFAHLEYMPLAGGDTAMKAPWKIAAAYLYKAFGGRLPDLPFLAETSCHALLEMLARNINVVPTSSCGRLFDAVAVMCGGKIEIDYEGQAAIEFMHAARADNGTILQAKAFDYELHEDKGHGLVITTQGILRDVAHAVRKDIPTATISRRFHKTLIDMFSDGAVNARRRCGINRVALSGGAMQNHLLFSGLMHTLRQRDFDVITHRAIPCNDGGISLGQAMIGRYQLK